MTDEYINAVAFAAAHYWANILRADSQPSCLRDAGFGNDGPDGVFHGAVTDMFIKAIRKNMPDISADQIDRFEAELANAVADDLRSEFPFRRILSTDYHPCLAIKNAADRAGIDRNNFDLRFPYKTVMWIGLDGIDVGEGYKSKPRSIMRTKRGAIRDACCEYFDSRCPEYEPDATPCGGERYDHWSKSRDAALKACNELPPTPRGSVAECVIQIVVTSQPSLRNL